MIPIKSARNQHTLAAHDDVIERHGHQVVFSWRRMVGDCRRTDFGLGWLRADGCGLLEADGQLEADGWGLLHVDAWALLETDDWAGEANARFSTVVRTALQRQAAVRNERHATLCLRGKLPARCIQACAVSWRAQTCGRATTCRQQQAHVARTTLVGVSCLRLHVIRAM